MEPMTLGSNPSSPASPGVVPNFLPSFLMGGDQPTPHNPSISPGRNKTPGSKVNDSRNLRQKLFNQSLADSPATHSPFMAVSDKGGPPKMGLFDTLEKKNPTSPILSSTVAHEPGYFNESVSRIINAEDSFHTSVRNGSSVSRFEPIDSQWVTVFGFPPSALNAVLGHLSKCGTIIDKKLPSQGNWVHLKFSNVSDVARALSLNGKCVEQNIMIGVNLHQSKENKENTMISTPIRARNLRHSFISPHGSSNVIPPQNVPQKSTGIVSKAMEYVFGW